MADAVALCEAMVAHGIKQAVATPHILPGRYDNNLESITAVWVALVDELKKQKVALHLGMAAEVRLDSAIPKMISQGEIPFLGEHDGKPVLLLELPHTHIPPGSLEFVNWCFKEGIQPLIAHPERNGDVENKLEKIKPFVEAGCLLQITAASLAGTFGPEPKKRGIQMLKQGWVHILATDTHNLEKRRPQLKVGRDVAEKYVGRKQSWEMVIDRPLAIAKGHFH